MNIETLEPGICQLKVCAERLEDTTLRLPNGDIVSEWPETLTMVSGTVMTLANVPNPVPGTGDKNETAWYEL